MNNEFKIVLFLFGMSCVPFFESIILKRRKHILYVYAAYVVLNFSIISAVKCYLGYPGANLFESFWDMQFITFVHYAIPMLVIDIAAPFILKVLFKEKDIDVIRFFLSSYTMTLLLCFLIVSKFTNQGICVVFCIALVMTLCSMRSIVRGSCGYVREGNLKESLSFLVTPLLLHFVTVVVYSPSELYLKNISDFPMSFWYYIGNLVLAGIAVEIILALGIVMIMTKLHSEVFMVVLYALVIAGYIQGLFLNGNMKVLDGTRQNLYMSGKSIVNIIIWVSIAGGIVLFFCMKRHTAKKIIKTIGIYVTLIQGVSLIILIVTSWKSILTKAEYVMTTDGMLEVADNENIIVLVLDKFDGRYMDLVLEDDPEFLNPLNDFTFYQNAAGEFPGTFTGIPYLLTGTPFDEESDSPYILYAYNEKNLLTDLNDAGFELGIYTSNQLVSEDMKDLISNYKSGVSIKCDIASMFSLMTRTSKYKMAPFLAKEYYLYDTSDVGLLVDDDRIVNILCDIPFYKSLRQSGLKVHSEGVSKAFKFVHMYGAHPPYTMTENFQRLSYDVRRKEDDAMALSQMRGALKIVYEYIRQLQEIGKYDNSLIIITADHGVVMRDENGEKTPMDFPILLVKNPSEKHEEMIYSKAPVCHEDIIATIRNFAGIDTDQKPIDGYEDNERRIRYFYATSGAKPFDKYQIDGDVANIDSWQLMYSR